jgi:hypothetical protein
VALLTHLEQFDRPSYSLAHISREQLVEKLCAAVAEWQRQECIQFGEGDCGDLDPPEKERLAILLDNALGEVK